MRTIVRFLSIAALMCAVASPAWAQCVPYVHYESGNFVGGHWTVAFESTTLNGKPLDLQVVMEPGSPPVDHGWSTHGDEVYTATWNGDGVSTFQQAMPYVATVDMQLTGLKGNRQKIEPFKVFRHYFHYKGEGAIDQGTGHFEGAKGHVVTRGPFWLDLIVIPGVGAIPAEVLGQGGGYYEFETLGHICGADLDGLGVR